MTPVDVLVVVVVVANFAALFAIGIVAYTRRAEIESLERMLQTSERARFVLEADVRALRRQRDFAEEEMERASRDYQARIAALTPRLGPGGRFVK